jgi:hypothetical protein
MQVDDLCCLQLKSNIENNVTNKKGGIMAKDVYEALAGHLDTLPTGFPRTENGSEMRILRRLFTPTDAELAIHLTILLCLTKWLKRS